MGRVWTQSLLLQTVQLTFLCLGKRQESARPQQKALASHNENQFPLRKTVFVFRVPFVPGKCNCWWWLLVRDSEVRIEALPETAALCILPWWLSDTWLVKLVLQYADEVLVLKLAPFLILHYVSVSNGVSAERSCSIFRLLMQRAVLAMQT